MQQGEVSSPPLPRSGRHWTPDDPWWQGTLRCDPHLQPGRGRLPSEARIPDPSGSRSAPCHRRSRRRRTAPPTWPVLGNGQSSAGPAAPRRDTTGTGASSTRRHHLFNLPLDTRSAPPGEGLTSSVACYLGAHLHTSSCAVAGMALHHGFRMPTPSILAVATAIRPISTVRHVRARPAGICTAQGLPLLASVVAPGGAGASRMPATLRLDVNATLHSGSGPLRGHAGQPTGHSLAPCWPRRSWCSSEADRPIERRPTPTKSARSSENASSSSRRSPSSAPTG